RVKAQGRGGSAHNQLAGERLARAPRSSSFLRPLSFLLGAAALLAAGAALWGQDAAPGPRARGAPQAAREAYPPGEYVQAQFCLDQAQPAQGALTEGEQRELADLVTRNRVALEGRRDGTLKLLQAEEALKQGRTQEAANLVRALGVNQYLSQED